MDSSRACVCWCILTPSANTQALIKLIMRDLTLTQQVTYTPNPQPHTRNPNRKP